MKRNWVLLVIVLFAMLPASAQQEGIAMAKSAGKALASYNIDPVGNAAKLEEARGLIEKALITPEAKALASAWITKGNIYTTRLQKDLAKKAISSNANFAGDNDALIAFEAYNNGHRIALQAYEKTDCIKGVQEIQAGLINIGISKYDKSEFEKAFISFRATIESHDLLKAGGQKSLLDNPDQLEDQLYITGLAASLANRCKDAMIYYNKLYKTGTDKPEVYEGLYNCRLQLGDEKGAGNILQEGRKKFPDNTALLFAEINLFLKAGRLLELTTRLEDAIKIEPDNISLYITLGTVYDNLYQSAQSKNETAKATAYFDKAKKWFMDALAKDAKNREANYSLGSLYYNKAAYKTQQLNRLPEDFSAEGMKKYKGMKDEIMGLFEQALPYFKIVESVDPNDMNTLIALVEIFARKENEEGYKAMKKRLDTVKGGGKNTDSYFK